MRVFARTPYVTAKVKRWARDEREFVRRAAFATIAGYTVHAKKAPDEAFLAFLPIIERYATDNRNFVRKAVNWALRQIGKHSQALHGPALALAETTGRIRRQIVTLDRQGCGEGTDRPGAARAAGRALAPQAAFTFSFSLSSTT